MIVKRDYDSGAVRQFTYLGDGVDARGGCEAAVTTRTRCGRAKFKKCGKLYGKRFPLKLEGVVYKSYVRPVLYGSEARCLEESEMGILRKTVRSVMSIKCEVQLEDRNRTKDMMLMLV